VLDIDLNGQPGERPLLLERGDTLALRTRIRSRDDRTPCVAVGIVRADGTPVYGVSSDMDGCDPLRLGPGEYACELVFDALALLPGSYTVRVHPMDPEGVRVFDTLERGITIRGATREFGLVQLPHRWLSATDGAPR
jgi:lipopolysaccharide transport system ATP-binding protein